jgi:hypothetical protein
METFRPGTTLAIYFCQAKKNNPSNPIAVSATAAI